MNTVYGGMLIAVAAGGLLGGALQYDPFSLGDTPRGPQQILSQPRTAPSSEVYDYPSPPFVSGVVPDYVVGTDWVPGGRRTAPLTAAVFDLPPYEPPPPYAGQYAYEEPAYAPPIAELPRPDPVTESAGEIAQIALADRQGGGQIDDLAHRPDPGALIGEPAI
jgi:hypothetical protein